MKKFPLFFLLFILTLLFIGLIFGFYKNDAKNIAILNKTNDELNNEENTEQERNTTEEGEISADELNQVITEEDEDLEKFLKRYDELLISIQLEQTKLSEKYKESNTDSERKEVLNSTKKYIFNIITNRIFSFWYGTEWDYNGITERPRAGKIACGYFVSTIMTHSGFMVERYKLAQQPSSLIIKTLALKSSIKRFNNIKNIIDYLKKGSNSIYILGLDNHVGFIVKHKDKIKFIHSSYLDEKIVISENLSEASKAIKQSEVFILGNVLDNVELLKKWLLRKKIATKVN
jgi:hypothetical protein